METIYNAILTIIYSLLGLGGITLMITIIIVTVRSDIDERKRKEIQDKRDEEYHAERMKALERK